MRSWPDVSPPMNGWADVASEGMVGGLVRPSVGERGLWRALMTPSRSEGMLKGEA